MAEGSIDVFYVYIIKCADDTLYTGWTTDLDRRINEHNGSKKGSRYTRARRPVKLVYSEPAKSRSAALKREAAIKNMTKTQKQALFQG